MRIMVTGAKGALGTDLCRIVEKGHALTATDADNLNVHDYEAVLEAATGSRPDLIIHLAALTDVDRCEREPEEAFRTNTIGTQNVALACQGLGIPMVYLSTLSVFDGTKPEPYTEFDTPNPHSQYSRSKYQGERMVRSLLHKYYIVRAGWMFGGAEKDRKFVGQIFHLAQSRAELKVVDDKFGSPTYTVDLARGLMALVATGRYGVYHMVNTGQPASRYEVAQAIMEYAGITGCVLRPVSSAEFTLAAPRPRMEAGLNFAAELIGLPPLRPWRAALEEYVLTTLLGRK
jgi:dTDP-4-dehydrorhamnose reductase